VSELLDWRQVLSKDPIHPLLAVADPALTFFTKKDLLDQDPGNIFDLWDCPEVNKIVRKQLEDGSWKYPGAQKNQYPAHHYPLAETWKVFRVLVDQYGLTREHPSCQRAAEFLFSCQTNEGDIRGMIGSQYATYYTGAIMSLLIKAGYEMDPRIKKGFQWLLSMRQDDGGWTIPILTVELSGKERNRLTSQEADPVQPDKTKPFSHNWTGMVLRAFAAHPTYRYSEAAVHAANLLKSRFFEPDVYSSYKAADHWLRFQFPFWWNNLVSALDSLSLIGLPAVDLDIQNALDWLIDHQESDGAWSVSYSKIHKSAGSKKYQLNRSWITLAICRIFKRFYS